MFTVNLVGYCSLMHLSCAVYWIRQSTNQNKIQQIGHNLNKFDLISNMFISLILVNLIKTK